MSLPGAVRMTTPSPLDQQLACAAGGFGGATLIAIGGAVATISGFGLIVIGFVGIGGGVLLVVNTC